MIGINDAKQLARRENRTGVVVFHFDLENDDFGFASYGKNRAHCQKMREWAGRVMDATEAGDIDI